MMRGTTIAALLLAADLFAGCTATSQGTASGQTSAPAAAAATTQSDTVTPLAQPIGTHCPQAGTVARYSEGAVLTFLGTDPSAADLCIGRNAAGNPFQLVRGIWAISGIWPDSIPGVRDAMTKLTTMVPGTEVTMTVTGRTASGTDPRPGTWTHTVKVLGEQSVSVTAGTFRSVLIADHDHAKGSTGYDGTHYIWIDRETGLRVKGHTDTTAGNPPKNPDWELTSLQRPG
jgi:hypothetical protein